MTLKEAIKWIHREEEETFIAMTDFSDMFGFLRMAEILPSE